MDTTARIKALRRTGFDLPDDVSERLIEDFTELALDEGDFLFHEGEPGNSLFVVLTGKLEAVTTSDDGRELVFRTMYPDAIIGELTILDGAVRTAAIRALESSVVMRISRARFLSHANVAPSIGLALAQICAARARDLSQWVSTSAFATVESRLAGTLLTMLTNPEELVVRTTQQALGDRLGVSRESINKWLRSWEKDGTVRLGRSTITALDLKRLEAIALS